MITPDKKTKKKKRQKSGKLPKSLNVRELIGNGIITGLKPDEIRDMTPRDTFAVFEGWQKAHSPNRAGSKAPTIDEARELALRYG